MTSTKNNKKKVNISSILVCRRFHWGVEKILISPLCRGWLMDLIADFWFWVCTPCYSLLWFMNLVHPKRAVLQLCYKSSYELNMCDTETIFSYISFLFGLFLIYIIQKEWKRKWTVPRFLFTSAFWIITFLFRWTYIR